MWKYILKRVGLMLLTFFIIMFICFVMIRLLPDTAQAPQKESEKQAWLARREALGYNKPIMVQWGIYLKNVFTKWDFGTSWKIDYFTPAWDVIAERLLPTVLVNVYSLLISIPIGLGLGILAAVKKNKWQDHTISTLVMVFVSVPSYVYAFLVQYIFYFKLGWFDRPTILPLSETGGTYFSGKMFVSMLMPIMALSFGTIAGLARFTRAELTETLTSDYMLLARAKGLTRGQATVRHAMKNAMVPILPMLIGEFIGVLGGSMIIEEIFSIPGVGQLYMKSINQLDYDVFMIDSIFYTFVGLLAGIVVDISYGFIDPRIRMGEK